MHGAPAMTMPPFESWPSIAYYWCAKCGFVEPWNVHDESMACNVCGETTEPNALWRAAETALSRGCSGHIQDWRKRGVMPRYIVTIEQRRVVRVTVRAGDEDSAWDAVSGDVQGHIGAVETPINSGATRSWSAMEYEVTDVEPCE